MTMQLYITHLYHHAPLGEDSVAFGTYVEPSAAAASDEWKPVPLSGLAALTIEQEWSEGAMIYSLTLDAILRCSVGDELVLRPRAWRIITADGRQWVIGDGRRPHPQCLLTLSTPDTPRGDSRQRLRLTLTTGREPLIRYVVTAP